MNYVDSYDFSLVLVLQVLRTEASRGVSARRCASLSAHRRRYRQSAGSVGDRFGNALAENLWSTLEEPVDVLDCNYVRYRGRRRVGLLRCIDRWCNTRRIQFDLGGLVPTSTNGRMSTGRRGERGGIQSEFSGVG